MQAGADWCQPCQKLRPMLERNAADYIGEVQFVYMDVEKFPELADHLEVKFVPQTFMVYKGNLISQFGVVQKD